MWRSSPGAPGALDRSSSPHSLMLGVGLERFVCLLKQIPPELQSRLPPSFILHVYNQQALWIDSHRSSQSKFIDNCHFQILQLSDGIEYHTLLHCFLARRASPKHWHASCSSHRLFASSCSTPRCTCTLESRWTSTPTGQQHLLLAHPTLFLLSRLATSMVECTPT